MSWQPEDGRPIERQLMTLALSCDHRILYGPDTAQFLSTIRELLEQSLGPGLALRECILLDERGAILARVPAEESR